MNITKCIIKKPSSFAQHDMGTLEDMEMQNIWSSGDFTINQAMKNTFLKELGNLLRPFIIFATQLPGTGYLF